MASKAILPKKINRFNFIPDKTARDIFALLSKEFLYTYRTWNNKPVFRAERVFFPDGYGFEYYTDDLKYFWISMGTRKNYPISPKRFGYLKIGKGWRPKTRPGSMFSTAGSSPSSFDRVYKEVKHPGITPRLFDFRIAKKVGKKIPAMFQIGLNEWARNSGHAIQ